MDEYHMARRELMAEGRPKLGSLDGVKMALGNRGMSISLNILLLL